ncbi:5-oxoprolinase/urea amidolyase family protein [Babesia caballi]|uniref:5-oxoprolinase/urea amidolyase family protein n=1 Tax=Babesia caballi TaxID=5871 RepID=Q8IU16_BABCB|nr:hypothetical protein [Babesia caballi]GIX61282.1 5-oxoprolinase/urea amidolyase family protein [Babesia caballi]
MMRGNFLLHCVKLVLCTFLVGGGLPQPALAVPSKTALITLDFSAGQLDPRLEMYTKLKGITRYFVKDGVEGTIATIKIRDYTIEMPADPEVEEVLCASPFNGRFTIHFSDSTSDEVQLTASGIHVGANKNKYIITKTGKSTSTPPPASTPDKPVLAKPSNPVTDKANKEEPPQPEPEKTEKTVVGTPNSNESSSKSSQVPFQRKPVTPTPGNADKGKSAVTPQTKVTNFGDIPSIDNGGAKLSTKDTNAGSNFSSKVKSFGSLESKLQKIDEIAVAKAKPSDSTGESQKREEPKESSNPFEAAKHRFGGLKDTSNPSTESPLKREEPKESSNPFEAAKHRFGGLKDTSNPSTESPLKREEPKESSNPFEAAKHRFGGLKDTSNPSTESPLKREEPKESSNPFEAAKHRFGGLKDTSNPSTESPLKREEPKESSNPFEAAKHRFGGPKESFKPIDETPATEEPKESSNPFEAAKHRFGGLKESFKPIDETPATEETKENTNPFEKSTNKREASKESTNPFDETPETSGTPAFRATGEQRISKPKVPGFASPQQMIKPRNNLKADATGGDIEVQPTNVSDVASDVNEEPVENPKEAVEEKVSDVSQKEIDLVIDGENPNVLSEQVEDITCYKGKNGTIIRTVEINGKTRSVGASYARETIVCVQKMASVYNVAVGSVDENGRWSTAYLSKAQDLDIFIDVSIKSNFRNVSFAKLFGEVTVVEEEVGREPLVFPNFFYNGRSNASLTQMEASGCEYVLETVDNGYQKVKRMISFAHGSLVPSEGMVLLHMRTANRNDQEYLTITFKKNNVLLHRRYVDAQQTEGIYKWTRYLSKLDHDLSVSIASFELEAHAKLSVINAETVEADATLYGLPVQKFGRIIFLNVPMREVDTILLLRNYEVLLKGSGNHTVALTVVPAGIAADITSELGGVVSRTFMTPDSRDLDKYDIDFPSN